MTEPTVNTFLSFRVEGSADLPKEYADVLRVAEPILVRWPTSVIPPLGARLNLDDLCHPLDEVVVDEVVYNYCEKHLTLRIWVIPYSTGTLDELSLRVAAGAGCESNEGTSLADMFKVAGISISE